MSNIYTSDDYENKKKKEAREEQLKNLSILAGTAGIGYASINSNNETLRQSFELLPGSKRYSKKDIISRAETLANGYDPIDVSTLYKKQSVGKSIQSTIASIEELSPLNILKTLQTSNFIEPFIDISPEQKNTPIHLTSDSIAAYQDFYNAQIKSLSGGKRKLTSSDLNRGFFLVDGILYAVQPDGSIDYNDPVMKKAKLVTSSIKIGDHYSPNKLLEKFANRYNVDLDRKHYQQSHLVAVGSNSNLGMSKEWLRSYFRYSMEIGYKSLDNPLGGVEELLSASGLGQTNFFSNPIYQKVKSKLNINLGTQGHYNLSTKESLKLVSKNLAVKSAAAYIGYNAVNSILEAITPESSAWNNGIISGLTANYANISLGVAKVFSDRFQNYKQAQEEAAPDSTSIMTLIGFPLAGAMLGASSEYYKRMYLSSTKNIEYASNYASKEVGYGILDKPLKKLGFKDTTPMKSKAIIGGVVGAMIAAPFLPGALIGKSSEELKQEFSGEKLVENRTNAGWLMGGGKFEGENVKNYDVSWVTKSLLNIKNTVRYGDNETKRDLDPILSPFSYLQNPYQFEEMHTKDMPYPVWGMDVNYGSFLGKAFQGTLGEIIKPTVVNQEFISQMQETVREIQEYNSEEGSLNVSYSNQSTSYSVPLKVRPKERSLINEGLMYSPENPSVNPYELASSNTYATLADFTGLKGFSMSLTANALGFKPEDVALQLARSGTATSAAEDLREANVGDIGGLGEFVRRLVPHTSSSVRDYSNPMLNQIAPSWMPSDESRYYINFQHGNYWDKVDSGETRLAGIGFNMLNPELKNRNPDDYPLVYQYKILSDTAFASPEHLALKDILLKQSRDGKLNEEEIDIFYSALEREQKRTEKKEFREYATDKEFRNFSLGQKLLSSIWEPIAHNSESVLEPLTPFRPGSKFIHARTAIEDYEKTQLQGPDTAIWTNPYSHFIKPAINRTIGLLPGTQIPEEAQQRDSLDEYFDKLEYLKARREGNTNAALKTVLGSTFAGIYNTETMNKFKSGLTDDQRLYVDSFAKETDLSKRKKILEMLPSDVSVAYQSIWTNLEIAEQAKQKGINPEKAVIDYYTNNTNKFIKAAGGTTDKYKTTPRNPEDKFEAARELRLRAADKIAEEYISKTTGIPDQGWIGWDPRLSADDIKLRTLTMGKADIYRHGFWESDVQRNERIIALDHDTTITADYNKIRNNIVAERKLKNQLENNLFDNGFITRRIELSPASRNDIVIRDRE